MELFKFFNKCFIIAFIAALFGCTIFSNDDCNDIKGENKMQRLVFTNANGISIDLTKDPYGITKWGGFANTGLNIQSQQVPFHDGSVFLDALLNNRELSVTLAINDKNDLEKRYELRRELISILNPKLGEGVLVYTNDFTSKQIKCVPKIPLFDTHNSNTKGTPKANLAWTACDPYWEDLEESFEILSAGQTKSIENNGDCPCSVKIDLLSNNLINPKIQNLTNNKTIKLNGTFENQNIKINTEAGKKSVYSENFKFLISNSNVTLNKIIYVDKIKSYVMLFISGILISEDALNWNYINTLPQTYYNQNFGNFNSIIFSEQLDLFVVVGSGGEILTSPDLINWQPRLSGYSRNIKDIAYSERLNLFVAVGENCIFTSSDGGITWTYNNTYNDKVYNSIIYTEEKGDLAKFIAVGERVTSYSSDGINWTVESVDNILMSICFSNEKNRCVAVGMNSTIYYARLDNQYAIPYWTFVGSFANNFTLYSVVYSNEINAFLATGEKIFYSFDGQNWININENNLYVRSSIYSKNLGKFICVGRYSEIFFVTLEKLERIKESKITNRYSFFKMSYSEKLGLFVFIDSEWEGNILISSDGINFDSVNFNIPHCKGLFWIEDLNLFIAIQSSYIYTSSDGINWTTISTTSETENFSSLAYSKNLGLFVAVGTSGKIYTSSDLISWTLRTSGTSYNLNKIIYSKEKELFIVVGGDPVNSPLNAIILTSSDAINWTTRLTSSDFGLKDVCYSKNLNLFVAVGGNDFYHSSRVYLSYDGINWRVNLQTLTSGVGYMTSIKFSERLNMFLCSLSEFGNYAESYNGMNWFEMKSGSQCVGRLIEYSNRLNIFLISADHSTIMICKLEEFENLISTLSSDSDMDLKLEVGKNELLLNSDSENTINAMITYRQKYVGV